MTEPADSASTQRPSVESRITADLLRAAAAHATAHDEPLWLRLTPTGEVRTSDSRGQPAVVAVRYFEESYRFEAAGQSDGCIPRAEHFQWVEERVLDGDPPDSLIEGLGEDEVAELEELDIDTYARAYGGPTADEPDTLTAWMEGDADVDDEMDADMVLLTTRGSDPGYQAFLAVMEHYDVGQFNAELIWNHPDTGAEIGRITSADSTGDIDVTWFAEGHVALSCLRWLADLAGIGLEIETRRE